MGSDSPFKTDEKKCMKGFEKLSATDPILRSKTRKLGQKFHFAGRSWDWGQTIRLA